MRGDTETTGTPETTQEGANAEASGTPAGTSEGGNAAGISAEEKQELESLRVYKQQALAEKGTLERTKYENEQLRAQMEQQARAYSPPTGYDPVAREAQEVAQAFQEVQERDPAMARLLIANDRMTRDQLARQESQAKFYREMGSIPEADRAEVERISRTDNLWPSMAHDRVRARRFDAEKNELAEQRRKLHEDQDRMKRGVVKTTAEPSPATSKSDEITDDEYNRLIADAEKGNRDARKRLDDVDYGRVRIRSG